MDINKLSNAEKIIGASGIVLLIASFLPWFSIEIFGVSYSESGWDDFLFGIIPTLIGVAMAAQVILSNFAENVKLPELPWSRVHLIGGIVAGALIVLKLLLGDSKGGIDLDRSFGLILAALAGIGLAVGGFLYNKEHEGTSTAM